MWDESVVTNAGAALLERWAAGGTLVIDGATAGTGTVPAVALCNAKSLLDERQTLSITQTRATEGGMQYTMQFSAPEEGYTCNQIGLWAHLENEPRTLLAIYQDAQGFVLPSKTDMPDFVYVFYALVQMSNEGSLEVTIDGSAYASVDMVTQRVQEAEAKCYQQLEAMRGAMVRKLWPVYIQAEKPPEQSIWIQPIGSKEEDAELLIETAPLTEDAAHRIIIEDADERSITNAVTSEKELTNKNFWIVQ